MTVTIQPEAPPLRIDEAGAIRVGKTRVLLVLVLRAYLRGETPEEIVQAYDTLDLADVYAVIAYYLRHRAELDKYLEEYEREGNELMKRIEAAQPGLTELRERFRTLRATREANP
jgi:uncharacterized protein (DUF433 family)